MHTKDKLAAALTKAGLTDMATKAAEGYYDDFLSPLAMPMSALMAELAAAGTEPALALRKRVMNGDFDATEEESEAWADSPAGQATMNRLKGDPQ